MNFVFCLANALLKIVEIFKIIINICLFYNKKRGGVKEVVVSSYFRNETYSNHFGDYKMVECVMNEYEI